MRPVLGYTTLYSQRIIGLKKNIPAYLLQYEAHNISIGLRIRYIRDVINEDGSFKNWNDIKNATSNGINFLEFYSIISSVKSFFSKQDIASESNPLQGFEGPNINCYFFQYNNQVK